MNDLTLQPGRTLIGVAFLDPTCDTLSLEDYIFTWCVNTFEKGMPLATKLFLKASTGCDFPVVN